MCKPQVANGAHCPRTTRPGNRSATPLPAGVSAACGMRCCASKCAQGRKAGQAQRGHHRLSISQDRLKRGQHGYDAGKRVKGRKRHIASDTMGLLLAVVVHSTGIQDRAGVRALQIRLFLYFESLKTIFVDGSYSCSLINWALSMLGWNMQVIKRCQQRVFRVLPKRWVVQRTFAWLSQSRRMSKDYEVSVASAEAFIKIACIRRMVRPLR